MGGAIILTDHIVSLYVYHGPDSGRIFLYGPDVAQKGPDVAQKGPGERMLPSLSPHQV